MTTDVDDQVRLPRSLREDDWRVLIDKIKRGKCIPFLGAGASSGTLPVGREIASEWATDNAYPLEDKNDLARVAQFLAIKFDPLWPKHQIIDRFKSVSPPNFTQPDEPHSILAELPLKVYMTTNYDSFMLQALSKPGINKNPKQEYCRWNMYVRDEPSVFDSGFEPSTANPLVYHLHGCTEIAQSIVITEDDYLEFLVNMSKDDEIIPHRLQKALSESSLLFLGYRLSDWNFRILFQSLFTYVGRGLSPIHMSVQLAPFGDTAPAQQRLKALDYLDNYFGASKVRVYWGTCRDFARELRQRWEASTRVS